MCGTVKLIFSILLLMNCLVASDKVRNLYDMLNRSTSSQSKHVLRSTTQEVLDATLWIVLYDTSVVPNDCIKICKQLLRSGANPNYERELECTSLALVLERCIQAHKVNDKQCIKKLYGLIKLLLQYKAQPTEAMLIIVDQTFGCHSSLYKELSEHYNR